MAETKEVYTIAEAAKLLRVSDDTIRRLIANGQLEAHQVGRQWRIPKQALEKYLGRSL